MQVEETWAKLKLPHVPKDAFENDFELLLYKTLNLIRVSPEWAIPHVKSVRSHKHYTGANIEIVIQLLRRQGTLPLLELSN
jgi:hypothetical protein